MDFIMQEEKNWEENWQSQELKEIMMVLQVQRELMQKWMDLSNIKQAELN